MSRLEVHFSEDVSKKTLELFQAAFGLGGVKTEVQEDDPRVLIFTGPKDWLVEIVAGLEKRMTPPVVIELSDRD